MSINPAMRAALRALSYTSSIGVSRTYKAERALRRLRAPLAPLYRHWDQRIERNGRQIPVRIYEPAELQDQRLLLFFHGGGWVLENLDTYNSVCRNLAKQTGRRVISVEYALAPEHPFPEGLEDCYAAARVLYNNPAYFGVQAQDITLIGDSAGGNLAAAVSLLARDRGEFSVQQQVLIYPATYHDHSPQSRFDSVRENGTDYLLTSRRVCEYMEMYAGNNSDNLKSPYFAPLNAPDLSYQPRTLVITAQYDPLRDEGEAYAARLQESGAEVSLCRMEDALHGYLSLPARFPLVRQTFTIIRQFLNGEDVSCSTNLKAEKP